ncbi:MAG TPA: thiol reductant ABC exporter subunit CydC [Mycobacteriales bacterium]
MTRAVTRHGDHAVGRILDLAPWPRRRFAGAVGLGTLALGSAVGLMAVSAWLISRAAQHPPVLALGIAVVAVRGLAIGRAVFRYFERLVSHDVAFRQLGDLRVVVAARLEPLAPAGLAAFRRGGLLTRLVADVDGQQDLPLRVVEPIAVGVLVGALSVGTVAWLLPPAGLVLAVAVVVAATVVPVVTAAAGRRSDRLLAPARDRMSTVVVETLRAAPDLVACGADRQWLARAEDADAELSRVARATGRVEGIGAGLAALVGGLAVWGMVEVGIPAVRSGTLRGVDLAVVVLLPLATWEAVSAIAPALSVWSRVRTSAGRLADVLDAPVPVASPAVPVPVADGPGRIAVRRLTARWPADPDAPDDDRPRGVSGVDLDLGPGRRVAVVGPTGAGKTTLAAALLRFVDVSGGDYVLDGTDVLAASADDVRMRIGHVAGDAHIFDSTVRENLRLARPDATEEELWDAMHQARLTEWVRSLPEGVDTYVGERGARMSGGERTRLALARALLARRPVLLLDEPTAALDPATAEAVTADLLAAGRDRAVLLVTHRLAGLDGVDEVLVLDSGRVVQRGRPADLAQTPGPYADLLAHDSTAAVDPVDPVDKTHY